MPPRNPPRRSSAAANSDLPAPLPPGPPVPETVGESKVPRSSAKKAAQPRKPAPAAGEPEEVPGDLYDFPVYYDLVFGSDWRAEYEFLFDCYAQHATRPLVRIFEPACGTGRLLHRLAADGYAVAGNDLNPHAIDYCNRRLVRHGFPATAVVGDMTDFTVPESVDLAFCFINTFRHLPTEEAALACLRCTAASLAPGGLFLLGLHLTPTVGERMTEENWSARRGGLRVDSHMVSLALDEVARCERVALRFEITTPTRRFALVDELRFRTYTAKQFAALLGSVPDLEWVETYDFRYDLASPVRIDGVTEDVVAVLRKRN